MDTRTTSTRVVVESLAGRPVIMAAVTLLFIAFAAGFFSFGYQAGQSGAGAMPEEVVSQLRDDWAREQAMVEAAREKARYELDALASHVGRLQAHVLRLDALGERLATASRLDVAEFGFGSDPALGGPVDPGSRPVEAPDFIRALNRLTLQLEARGQQLDALETLLLTHQVAEEARPDGRPIKGGWISSFFGKRTDPFTGRKETHKGLDMAAARGTEIFSVAPGVVSFSGRKTGYGRLVEINHGSGYVTRYGHNEENLVKVGQQVGKGEVVAKMGSSGRSTGPHVHFEVLKFGKAVNPANFLPATE